MKNQRVLITGSAGLIGRGIAKRLQDSNAEIIRYDLRHEPGAGRHDLLDRVSLERALRRATGVVHLAAIARVNEGERDPLRCWATNVEATRVLLELACQCSVPPWVVFASSREVYGQQSDLPVSEDAPLQPANTYARSKAVAETLFAAARDRGLNAAIVRFSNVYGDIDDYPDRVVPAFAAAAARGGALRVDGADNVLDFTHVDDAAEGLLRVVRMVVAGERNPPPVHLVSGVRTTLGDLAALAVEHGAPGTRIIDSSPRAYAVRAFVGDPSRARALLGWQASVTLEDALPALISGYQAAAPAGESLARPVRQNLSGHRLA
jgi:nucleoside-diphosphate-sugar epimerase